MGYDADLRNALSAVNTSFNTIGEDIYSKDLPGAYQTYTEIVPANGLSTYRIDFGGATPVMREWLGPKVTKQFRAYTHSLTLTKYEKTIAIDRMEMAYDKGSGIVSKKVGQFLSANAGAYDKFAFAALVAAGTGYDAVSLFSASHPHGNSTNSNTGTSSLTKANLDSTMIAMAKWQNEYGEPIGVRPTTLLCGPDNESKAREILETGDRIVAIDSTGSEATAYAYFGASKQNIYQGILKLVVDPRFADGTRNYYWFLIDESQAQKPIICVEGRKPQPVTLDTMDSETRFFQDKYYYSVEGDFVFGPGFWWTIYRQAATA